MLSCRQACNPTASQESGDEPQKACVKKHRINIEKDLFLCKCNFLSFSSAQLEWQ